MKGDTRCTDGRLMRHDPQHDDPDLETDIGTCPDCDGEGCERVAAKLQCECCKGPGMGFNEDGEFLCEDCLFEGATER